MLILASYLNNAISELFEDTIPDSSTVQELQEDLISAAHGIIDWPDLAEAILVHDDLWEKYLEEKDRWDDALFAGEEYASEVEWEDDEEEGEEAEIGA